MTRLDFSKLHLLPATNRNLLLWAGVVVNLPFFVLLGSNNPSSDMALVFFFYCTNMLGSTIVEIADLPARLLYITVPPVTVCGAVWVCKYYALGCIAYTSIHHDIVYRVNGTEISMLSFLK